MRVTAPLRPFADIGCLAFHYTQFSQNLLLVTTENAKRFNGNFADFKNARVAL